MIDLFGSWNGAFMIFVCVCLSLLLLVVTIVIILAIIAGLMDAIEEGSIPFAIIYSALLIAAICFTVEAVFSLLSKWEFCININLIS